MKEPGFIEKSSTNYKSWVNLNNETVVEPGVGCEPRLAVEKGE